MKVAVIKRCTPAFCLLVFNYLKLLPPPHYNNGMKWFFYKTFLEYRQTAKVAATYYYDLSLVGNCLAICTWRTHVVHGVPHKMWGK